MADAFRKSGQLDSAFKYSYASYNGARQYAYPSLLGSSSGLLAKLFIQKNKYDSAVKYMTVERDYRDSITGTETLNSIQFLTNEYQLKGLEKQREKEEAIKQYKATLKNYFFAGGVILLLLVIGLMYRVNKQRTKSKKQIETSYNDLKATQAQLIQSEKMASLGELTAGIAHEIQNPLNFVNNFSEVSKELLEEMKTELDNGNSGDAKEIAIDVIQNLEKINHHGKRADAIIKGMLQHSQSGTGKKEPTDINALCDEYLRLSYHGLRAKDKSFNATLKTDFDESIGKINIVPQDIGRVIMNLLTNAFYAVNEKKKLCGDNYQPTVTVSTSCSPRLRRGPVPTFREVGGEVIITIKDNGAGIPQNIIDKIFQPFFTTKPTGQGTGLGLSLAYDIVKAHGGQVGVDTKEGEGSTFSLIISV
ncbi:MAG: two-component sensor histidine kinase [Rhizobacter sp.]|nr:two-component sensor histidine kinase [Ferruginibacter sp.]